MAGGYQPWSAGSARRARPSRQTRSQPTAIAVITSRPVVARVSARASTAGIVWALGCTSAPSWASSKSRAWAIAPLASAAAAGGTRRPKPITVLVGVPPSASTRSTKGPTPSPSVEAASVTPRVSRSDRLVPATAAGGRFS